MSTNATSLLLPRPWEGADGPREAEHSITTGWRGRLGVTLLGALVAVCLVVVVVAADRPSFIVPPSAQHYFPNWLAGPFGGLLPHLARSTRVLQSLFTYGLVAMYVAYVALLAVVRHVRARWVIAAIVAVHVVLLLAPPLALTDVFNYLNYGRMEVIHGLNPYASIPMVEPHDDPAFAMSNWHHLLSPYGPMFTIMTFALVPFGVPVSFWLIKVILMLSSLGTLALAWKCARLLGRDPVRVVVFVGLNPVVLLWGLGGDHNDFITVFFVILAFYLLLRSRAAAGRLDPLSVATAHVSAAPASAPAGAPPPSGGDRVARAPVSPMTAVTPAVAGPSLGYVAQPPVAGRVSRRALTAWWPHARTALTGAMSALRPRGDPSGARVPAASPVNGSAPVSGDGAADTAAPASANGATDVAEPAAGTDAPDPSTSPETNGAGHRSRLLTLSEVCAGVSLVIAVSMKASAAILIPVVLLGLAWSRRRVVNVAVGMAITAVISAIAAYAAFGPHIPDLSTQDKLITAESLPNLLGLLLGQGGETDILHFIVQGVLLLSVASASWWAWRRREFVTPAAWVTVALLATLSWVLPWYVLWLLPLAALAGSRRLQRVALAFGVYLILVWAPLAGSWYAAIHFAPTKTALGRANQRETKLLLH